MMREDHQQKQRDRDAEVPKPDRTKTQGIVRDQRGQEQPADKERAQRTSKGE